MFYNLLYKGSVDGMSRLLKIEAFLVFFYTAYLIVALLGNIIIDYIPISFTTYSIYFLYVFSIAFGAYLGGRIQFRFNLILFDLNINSITRACIIFGIVSSFILFLLWRIIINHYGSIEFILLNSDNIRNATIAKSQNLTPVIYGYIISLAYAAGAVSLVLFNYKKKGRYVILPILFFVQAFFIDLQSFGRVGILFVIFMAIGYIIIFAKKILNTKFILSNIVMFVILQIPRLIRGSFDNFTGTYSRYSYFMKVELPPFLYSLITTYIYYFTSPYALSAYFDRPVTQHTYGSRLLAPVSNLLNRLFAIDYSRITLLDEFDNVPMHTNVYTIIRDIFSDFGIVGIFIVSLFIGIFIGYAYKENSFFYNAMQIFILGWLFLTPINNCLSSGSFFISFIVLLFLMLFVRVSDKKELLEGKKC